MTRSKIKYEIGRNRTNTIVLLSLMAGLPAFLGWIVSGAAGVLAVSAAIAAGIIFSPRIPSKVIMRLYGCRPVSEATHPGLYSLARTIAARAGLKQAPQLHISPRRHLNAFAAGSRQDPAVCVSLGLLNALSTEEVAGILSHEIAHLKNNDTRSMTLAGFFHRLTHFLSCAGLVFMVLMVPFWITGEIDLSFAAFFILMSAPMVSMLLQLALSRTREFEADLESALILNSPYPLASALQKLESLRKRVLSHFMAASYVPSPPQMFSTHPDTNERIKRLLAVATASPRQTVYPGIVPHRRYIASRPILIPMDSAHWMS